MSLLSPLSFSLQESAFVEPECFGPEAAKTMQAMARDEELRAAGERFVAGNRAVTWTALLPPLRKPAHRGTVLVVQGELELESMPRRQALFRAFPGQTYKRSTRSGER
jgi:hypothetical protein